MQRKRKTKSKENPKFASRKKKSMKIAKSRTFFTCHISQHFDKKNIFYFEINSVKSKRKKKARRSSKQLLYLKERKKCLLSPNKNNDL
jgi:hypothetical protein